MVPSDLEKVMTNEQPVDAGEQQKLGEGGLAALQKERDRADKAEKDLKVANQQITDLESAHKAEVERLTTAASEAKTASDKALADAELVGTKYRLALEEGLRPEAVRYAQGADEESIKASISELKELFKVEEDKPFPKADPSQGAKTGGAISTADQFASALNDAL